VAADIPVVTLATAHPAKFPDAVERATGLRPSLPRASAICSTAKSASIVLPSDYAAVRDYVLGHAARA
jgi:threonine synthase